MEMDSVPFSVRALAGTAMTLSENTAAARAARLKTMPSSGNTELQPAAGDPRPPNVLVPGRPDSPIHGYLL